MRRLALLTTNWTTPPIASNTGPRMKPVKSIRILALSIRNLPSLPINSKIMPMGSLTCSMIGPNVILTRSKTIPKYLLIGPKIGSMIGPNSLPTHSPRKLPIALPTIGAKGPRKGPSSAVPAIPPRIPPTPCPIPAPTAEDACSPLARPAAILPAPPTTPIPTFNPPPSLLNVLPVNPFNLAPVLRRILENLPSLPNLSSNAFLAPGVLRSAFSAAFRI